MEHVHSTACRHSRVPVDDDLIALVLLLDLLKVSFEDGVLDVGNLEDRYSFSFHELRGRVLGGTVAGLALSIAQCQEILIYSFMVNEWVQGLGTE